MRRLRQRTERGGERDSLEGVDLPLGLNCAAQLPQILRLLDHVPRWLRLGWISEFPGLRSAHGCGPSDAVRSPR